MSPGDDAGRRPSGLSRRRLLTGIGGVGAVGMASGLGTGAYLADRETFRANVFGAGEVGLTVDGEATDGSVTVGPFAVDRTTFDGRPDPERFEIGASANPVRVWLATECPDGDRLGNALEVEVVVDGESVTDGYRPLSEVERLLATGVRIGDGCLEAGLDGGSIAVEVTPYLPADSSDVGGETTELVFHLYAEQCRHVTEEQANDPGANPFADVVCGETDGGCAVCDDEAVSLASLDVRYDGDDEPSVAVVSTKGGTGGTLFEGTVATGDVFTLNGSDVTRSGNDGNGNGGGQTDRLGPEIEIAVDGGATTPIHVSCSELLAVGMRFGPDGEFEIVGGTTTDGRPICGTEAN
jgi:hypothetical protein